MTGQKKKIQPPKGHVLMKVSSATGIYREFLLEAGWHPQGTQTAVQTIENWTSSGEAAAVGHTWGRPPGSETADWIGEDATEDKQPPNEEARPKRKRAKAGRRK